MGTPRYRAQLGLTLMDSAGAESAPSAVSITGATPVTGAAATVFFPGAAAPPESRNGCTTGQVLCAAAYGIAWYFEYGSCWQKNCVSTKRLGVCNGISPVQVLPQSSCGRPATRRKKRRTVGSTCLRPATTRLMAFLSTGCTFSLLKIASRS